MGHALSALGALPVLQPKLGIGGGQLELVHIPKNGGTSIEDFGKARGLSWGIYRPKEDWPSRPLCSADFRLGAPDPGNETSGGGGGSPWHVPPRTWKERGGAQPYAGAETFCVARNPYTRIVSEFLYDQKKERATPGPPCGEAPLNAWVHDVLNKSALLQLSKWPYDRPLPSAAGAWDCHLLPSWVYTVDCDHVLRFETLSEEFGALMVANGLAANVSSVELPVSNIASCTMLATSLDERSRELVRAVYWRDFKRFNYSTDVPERALGFLDEAEVLRIDRQLASERQAEGVQKVVRPR